MLTITVVLSAQETRREIVNAAPTPEGDTKPNSDKVPDVYAIKGQFERILVLRFKYDVDLLASMEKMVKQEKIRNAVVLSGAGSVRGYHIHQVSNRDFPSKNMFVKNPTEPADVISMNRRLMAPDHSLNAPVRAEGEGEWQDWLVDERDDQETRLGNRQELGLRRDLLNKAMQHLSERERHILEERRLKDNPTTLEDLSQEYGISRERVRQIEVRAFEKLQRSIKHAATERRLLPTS